MTDRGTTLCPECGSTVPVVISGMRGRRIRCVGRHDHPNWPGQMCPGAMTKAIP